MNDMESLQQTLEQAHENELHAVRSTCHDEGKAQTQQAVTEMETKLQERHKREIVGFSLDDDSGVDVNVFLLVRGQPWRDFRV